MIKINYIHTIDFDFNNVEIINCKSTKEFEKRIERNKPILLKIDEIVYGINSAYIIYWE